MGLINEADEYEVFRCPKCSNFVSNAIDVCKYCSSPLDTDAKSAAISRVKEENRSFRIAAERTFFFTGIVTFLLGLVLMVYSASSVVNGGSFFIWSPIITLAGLGQIILGARGLWRERK